MNIIHTVEESRWGRSSRRTVVGHIMSVSSDCDYFLQERGGRALSTLSPAATPSFMLTFPPSLLFSLNISILLSLSFTKSFLSIPHFTFFSLPPLSASLSPPQSVTPTFPCKLPWQHPLWEEIRLNGLVINVWICFCQVAECADSRFVVKSDYLPPQCVYYQALLFYRLYPATSMRNRCGKANGQLVLM